MAVVLGGAVLAAVVLGVAGLAEAAAFLEAAQVEDGKNA